MLLTQAEYAAHRGITKPAIAYAVKKGVIKLDANGKIDPVAADKAWANGMRARAKAINSRVVAVPVTGPPSAPPPEDDDLHDLLGLPPKASSAPAQIHYQDARTQREHATAQLASLKVAEMAGELISAADVTRRWERIASEVRTALLQLAPRLAPMLVGKSQHDIRTMIDREVRETLTRLDPG